MQAGETFDESSFQTLLTEEYEKLLEASPKDVHEDSKTTTLPISKLIVERFVKDAHKAPWFIDLLNLNLNNENLAVAQERVDAYYNEFKMSGQRVTANLDTLVTI